MLDQTVAYMQQTAAGNWNVFSIIGIITFVSVFVLYFKRRDLYEKLVTKENLMIAVLALVASSVFGGIPLALGKLTGYANLIYQLILSGLIGYVFAAILIEGPRVVIDAVKGSLASIGVMKE